MICLIRRSGFQDGGQYRFEVPGIQGPGAMKSLLEQLEVYGISIHRVTQTKGIMLLLDEEIKEMVRLAEEIPGAADSCHWTAGYDGYQRFRPYAGRPENGIPLKGSGADCKSCGRCKESRRSWMPRFYGLRRRLSVAAE